MRGPENDHSPQAFCFEGCECLARHLPGKGISGVRNNQRPGVTRGGRCFHRLFDDESKLFGVIGVEAASDRWRPGRRARRNGNANENCSEKGFHSSIDKPCDGRLQLLVLALVGLFHRFELKIHSPPGELLRLAFVAFEPREPGESQINLGLLAVPPTGTSEVLARRL